MEFTIEILLPMPVGKGRADIIEAKAIDGKWGPRLQLTVEDDNKRTARGFFSPKATLSNMTGKLLMAIFGELRPMSPEELIGKTINVEIEHIVKDGMTYANITDIH
ncbi:hypothetical protein MYX76_07105 [Desulfobacterota bacterium AH_259_B03_O07]|nr:hypothetical protein [Desulfobacterota bacterium AH_259_B03_O07]